MFDMFSRLISIISRVAQILADQVAIAISKASPPSCPQIAWKKKVRFRYFWCPFGMICEPFPEPKDTAKKKEFCSYYKQIISLGWDSGDGGREGEGGAGGVILRTFAQKSSNTDFFIENSIVRLWVTDVRNGKKFGQGVRQQRVRNKTKQKAGTLPLALSMIRRVLSPQKDNVFFFFY